MALTTNVSADIRRLSAEILVITIFSYQAFLAPTSDDREAPSHVHHGLVITDDDSEPPFGRRLTRKSHLLDSLAQVCVSDSEVFAIGLAVRGNRPSRYQLIIAENSGVDNAANTYINTLLKLHTELSSAVAVGGLSPSPTMTQIEDMPQSVRDKQRAVFEHIFRRTAVKLVKRLETKRRLYDSFKETATGIINGYYNAPDTRDSDTRYGDTDTNSRLAKHLSDFISLADSLYRSHRLKKLESNLQAQVSGLYARLIIDNLIDIAEVADKILDIMVQYDEYIEPSEAGPKAKDQSVVPSIVEWLSSGNAANVKAGRKERKRKVAVLIQKITMLPRSAIAVAAWAFSPRLRHTFGGNTDWIPLESVTTMSVSPDDPVIDERIRRYSGIGDDEVLTKSSQDVYDDAYKGLKKTLKNESCIRHAGCAIVMRAAEAMRIAKETGAEPVRLCNYIAVNKLSCPCCWTFIEEWNRQHGTDWATSGCHFKPYKWGVFAPELDHADEAYLRCVKAVWDKMTGYFPKACELRFRRNRTQSQPRSDSSGEGSHRTEADFNSYRADEERVRRLAELRALEDGGE